MDGSTGNAGKLTSKNAIVLAAGDYVLQFDLAGAHGILRPGFVTAQVQLGTLVNQTISLAQSDRSLPISLRFRLPPRPPSTFRFEGAGGDNIGMLLDTFRSSGFRNPRPSRCWGSAWQVWASPGDAKLSHYQPTTKEARTTCRRFRNGQSRCPPWSLSAPAMATPPVVLPEPAALGLMAVGVAAVVATTFRKRK